MRAFCPECADVTVLDERGVCERGHQVLPPEGDETGTDAVGVDGGSAEPVRATTGDATDPVDVEPAPADDEPAPWVADLGSDDLEERPVAAGAEPDVDTGVDDADDVPDKADDLRLEPSERPGARSPEDSDAWQPPTTSPVGVGPQPPPEPVAPPPGAPAELSDLEAAVAELGLVGGLEDDDEPVLDVTEDDTDAVWTQDLGGEPDEHPVREEPATTTADERDLARAVAELDDEPAGRDDDVDWPEPEGEPDRDVPPPDTEDVVADTTEPPPPPEPAGPEPQADERPADDEAAAVDLANFTAGGKRVGERKRGRRLFRRD